MMDFVQDFACHWAGVCYSGRTLGGHGKEEISN